MHLIGPDLLPTQAFRRLTEMTGEPRDLMQISGLGQRREVANLHILDHATAKRGHRQLLCEMNSATWRSRIVSQTACQARGRRPRVASSQRCTLEKAQIKSQNYREAV
jgi:hypothetical protein